MGESKIINCLNLFMQKKYSIYKIMLCFLSNFFLVSCLFFSNFTSALGTPFPNKVDLDAKNLTHVNSDNLSLSSAQLGWNGPLTFGISSDNLFKYGFNAQYTQEINEQLALSGLVEYGNNSSRFNGTIGFGFLTHELLKISAERLSQNLPFTFDSGTINTNISQNAYGVSYQHVFEEGIIRTINFTGYYTNTHNKLLDPIIFSSGDSKYKNYRNVAGGTSKGFDVGSDLLLSKNTGISGHIFYDFLKYNTIYTPNSKYDTSGIGGNVSIDQIITDHIKLSVSGNIRKIYDVYKPPPAYAGGI